MKELLLLPVTSTSVELANSLLVLIRSPRRNSMTENQVNVFLFLFYHRDFFYDSINLDNATDVYCLLLFCIINLFIFVI